MANIRRKKEALRVTVMGFFAGAHFVTEAVERNQSIRSRKGAPAEEAEDRHIILSSDYERFISSSSNHELLVKMLNEEELYPFGSDWPAEGIAELLSKLIPPDLLFQRAGSQTEDSLSFRFRTGYKHALDVTAASSEINTRVSNSADHWLTLLLNLVFHAGVQAAAQMAENAKSYAAVMAEIEAEEEPWNRYPQLLQVFERQLKREARRKTGYLSTEDL